MRLKAIDKWVIGLVAVFTAAWGTTAVIAAFWNPRGLVEGIAIAAVSHPIVSGIAGALAILAAMHLFALAWPDEPRAIPLLGEAGAGQVEVSVRAVEGLVHQAAGAVPGVASTEVALRPQADNLRVHLEITLDGQRPIPQTSAAVQSEVERMLARVVGVVAHSVEVRVSGVKEPDHRGDNDTGDEHEIRLP